MTVTAQQSTQVSNGNLFPAVKNEVADLAKLRIARIDFTQSGQGDIGSTIDLVKLGAARYRIIPALSYLQWSAYGTGCTLSVGHTGWTNLDGSTVAAAPAAIEDTLDVHAAGQATLGVGTNAVANASGLVIECKTGVLLQAVIAGAVIPNGATLVGHIAYVTD